MRLPAVAGLACAVAAAAVVMPGAASAASRGFVVSNDSSHTFEIQQIKSVRCELDDAACRRNDRDGKQYPMDSEGVPKDAEFTCSAHGLHIRIADKDE